MPGRLLAGAVLFGLLGLPSARAQPAPVTDLNEVRAKAAREDVEAQNALGNIYTNALLGVQQDYAEALKWYRLAAEKGYAPAQFNLGLAHELGRGLPADERQAFKYYLMAAEQGFAAAQFNVGNMYSAGRGVGQDLFEANLWYKQAAEKGVIEAQFNLGLAYEAGRGVKKDEVAAARWYKQAADRGFVRAQYNLGLLLEDGRGVPKNETMAAGLYRAAAEQGFAAAQNNYGLMLSEGRGGLAKDPVQAYVWLSLAAANGSNPAARDFVGRSLSADQLATANNLLNGQKSGRLPPAPATAPGTVRAEPPAPDKAAAAQVAELADALAKAREANNQYAGANQRLKLENARLEQELSKGSESGKQVEQLRDQGQRLSGQLLTATADGESARRETAVLAAQVKDLRLELARQKESVAAVPPAPDHSKYESQIAALTTRLEQAAGSLSQLQQVNQQLTEGNDRLQKEKEAWAATAKTAPAATADAGNYPGPGADRDAIITNLQRDNSRLNDEVKRSTLELLSLNQQIHRLRDQSGKPAASVTGDNAASAEMRTENQRVDSNNTRLQAQRDAAVSDAETLKGQLRDARGEITRLNEQMAQLRATRQSSDAANDQLAELTSKAAQATEEAGRRQEENNRLTARVAELEKQPPSQADPSLAPRLAQAEQNVVQLQQQLKAVQADKAGLQELAQTQEKNLRESAVAAQTAGSEAADLRQKLAQAQSRLEEQGTARAAQEQSSGKLEQENRALAGQVAAGHESLVQAQARVAALEGDLQAARQQGTGGAARLDELDKQLAGAKQALEKSAATVAEMTVTAQNGQQELAQAKAQVGDLQQQLAAAKQAVADTGALRDELDKLRHESAGTAALREEHQALVAQTGSLRARNEQLTHESEQLAGLVAGGKHDLDQAQSRVADLEKQLEAAKAAHTGGASDLQKLQDEVTELTASKVRLGLDLAAEKRTTAETGALRDELDKLRHEAAAAATLRDQHEALVARMASEHDNLVQAQARITALEQDLQTARSKPAGDPAALEDLKKQLAEANQALEKNGATVAGLTAANDRLDKELAAAKQAAAEAGPLREELAKLQGEAGSTGALREENDRLRKGADEAAALRTKNEQLTRDGEQQAGLLGGNRRDLDAAQARVTALEKDLQTARSTPAGDSAALEDLKKQLAEANQALEKNGATVAELTAANDRLDKELAAAKQGAAEAGPLREELAKLQGEAGSTGALREENDRLRKVADEAAALRTKNEQLTRDSEQLGGNRRELEAAHARVTELEKLLEEARTVRTHGGDDTKKLQDELAEANQAMEKLNATVAELTGTNDRLEQDLDSARKSTAAALAAQSQAVRAAQPDAYKMEIGTLQAHIKELEGQMEEERNNTAKEIATLASQLQRTRETNKSLTEASRALLNAKQSEQPTVDKDQYDQLQGRVKELAAAGEELKRQNEKLAGDNQNLATERAAFKQQLEDARKAATALPGLAEEKAALQERLEAVGAQLIKTQQEVDTLKKDKADVAALAAAGKQAADKAQADLAALSARATEAEKASESHSASVAELTQANVKLEQEREDMHRLVDSYRADIARLTQNVRSTEQLKVEAERGAQQNIDAVTAQLGQLRRDLENTRTAQARTVEAGAAQDRERVAIITQLRAENAALAARLNQAQSTLDQIAAAARLGTPAATIAAGGTGPVRPVAVAATPQAGEVRFHTVAEGDSLSRISLRYYGTPNRWQEIFQANRDVLQGSSALRVGMQLRIP